VNLGELIATAVAVLERAGIPYMVTGSVASAYHGEPRMTRDLDIVIDPDPKALERLFVGLGKSGLYVDAQAADALQARTQFNAIDPAGAKIDFIVRRERPFSVEEFRRRRRADLLGTSGYLATAEDVIVAKLEWAAATDSERQRRDVAGMLNVSGEAIDRAYVERWVATLGLQAIWASLASDR
jgi:murein L,D-transpeptidase YcbB/YkuD